MYIKLKITINSEVQHIENNLVYEALARQAIRLYMANRRFYKDENVVQQKNSTNTTN